MPGADCSRGRRAQACFRRRRSAMPPPCRSAQRQPADDAAHAAASHVLRDFAPKFLADSRFQAEKRYTHAAFAAPGLKLSPRIGDAATPAQLVAPLTHDGR